MIVQILRLKDGSDVICNMESVAPGIIELQLPMMFQLVNQNLVLQHWLPLAVMKGNSVMISVDEVICIMEPNEDFKELGIRS